jgi:hypothetical protein
MGEALAHVVPDPGAAIVVAIVLVCGLAAFWFSTRPAAHIVDPVAAQFDPKPAADPEDAARKAVL